MPSLNSLNLDAFFACAQLKSFTRAAERLHITQSALSQRIKNLEDELGTTLIIRERSGLRLTELGQRVLLYCQTKGQIESELIERVRSPDLNQLSGVVRIGAFSSVARSVVLPALAPLLRENPAVQLKLMTQELYELPPLFKSGSIDFMVLDHELAQEGVATRLLGHERSVLVQKRGYKGPEIYLDHDEDDSTTLRFLKKKSAARIARRYLGDIYGIIDGVRLGLGKAVLPLHLTSGVSDLEILDPDRTLSVPVVLHHYEQPYYSKLHLAIVAALLKQAPRTLA
jgi:DNA-binding transcriptional LysR family regulator